MVAITTKSAEDPRKKNNSNKKYIALTYYNFHTKLSNFENKVKKQHSERKIKPSRKIKSTSEIHRRSTK